MPDDDKTDGNEINKVAELEQVIILPAVGTNENINAVNQVASFVSPSLVCSSPAPPSQFCNDLAAARSRATTLSSLCQFRGASTHTETIPIQPDISSLQLQDDKNDQETNELKNSDKIKITVWTGTKVSTQTDLESGKDGGYIRRFQAFSEYKWLKKIWVARISMLFACVAVVVNLVIL